MTRQEFIDDVSTIGELADAYEEITGSYFWDAGYMDDVADDEQLDDWINDWLSESRESWYDIRDILNDIPQGFDYYVYNGIRDIRGFDDDDFEEMKSDVLRNLDSDGYFDDNDEDEDDDSGETVPPTVDKLNGLWGRTSKRTAVSFSEEDDFEIQNDGSEDVWSFIA